MAKAIPKTLLAQDVLQTPLPLITMKMVGRLYQTAHAHTVATLHYHLARQNLDLYFQDGSWQTAVFIPPAIQYHVPKPMLALPAGPALQSLRNMVPPRHLISRIMLTVVRARRQHHQPHANTARYVLPQNLHIPRHTANHDGGLVRIVCLVKR